MTSTAMKPLDQHQESAINEALREFKRQHPDADIKMYRRNLHSVRIRVIHPVFRGMDRVQRDNLMWTYLEKLPQDVLQDVSMLVLLAPEELKDSFMNFDFEHPLPSSCV